MPLYLSPQALLADKVQHDAIFTAAANLAAESHMAPGDLRLIVGLISKTGTDQEALEILDKERASRALQIREFREANGHVAPVRPPYWVQMRKHLQFLIGRGPLDLFDPSLASREDSERLLREAAERLNEALKSIRSGGAMSTRQQQADSTNIQDASRVLDEAAVMVLDRLAVEGGHATRALLFERCKATFWGRMVNAAARRSGYDGHDEVELERCGKEQLFTEAVDRLLELHVIVIWDDEGDLLALHPTHRVPLRVGGPNYVPSTEFWRNQREQALTYLRTQLIQLRDNSFDAALRNAAALFAQQIRRGHIADEAREETLNSLIALADLLLQPSRLAQLLGLPETEIVNLWQRRLSPVEAPATTAKGRRRQPSGQPRTTIVSGASELVQVNVEAVRISDDVAQAITEDEPTPVESANGAENSIDGATLQRERESRGLSKKELAKSVAVSDSTLGTWESGTRPISPFFARQLHAFFASHPASNGNADG